jgi:hypothetical protein
VAHAASITEVWLALVEQGPGADIEVVSWLTDRAGWQEWERQSAWSSHVHRLTPDSVGTVRVDGSEVVVFVEVDLASMTQTVLKQKVARYLAYAADRAWEGRHPHCPPMLLLTTTATRAASFVHAAGQVIARHERSADIRDRAAALVIAACGLVRNPARAVVEPCWSLPDASVAELTLAELLAERLDAEQASQAWHYERDVLQRRLDDIAELEGLRDFHLLGYWFGSEHAAEALQLLVGADPVGFLDRDPELAAQVIGWYANRRQRVNYHVARELAEPFVPILEERHGALWQVQVKRFLAAGGWIAADHPHLYRLAKTLTSGRLVPLKEMAKLDTPPTQTRAEIQQAILATYHARRAAAEREWLALSKRDRHRASPEQLAVRGDLDGFATCDTCGLTYPPTAPGDVALSRCEQCEGFLIEA